ncbi:MAG: phosphoglycerate kinase [Hyphomicrobium sp.]
MPDAALNGPLGAFEIPPFGAGTFALAREAAKLTLEGKLTTVAGGGDTVAALNAAGVTTGLHLRLYRRRGVPRMA